MNNLQPSDDNPIDPTYIESDYLPKVRLHTFQKVTEDQVTKPVKKSAMKPSELDPILTSLLKKHLNVMVPVLLHITNMSLTESHFSNELKEALLRPLLKKISSDLIKKNYRPVLNLSYSSKLIKQTVCNQLTSIAAQSGNMEELVCIQAASLHGGSNTESKVRFTNTCGWQGSYLSCTSRPWCSIWYSES